MSTESTADVDLIRSADPEAVELDVLKETAKNTDDGQQAEAERGAPEAENQDEETETETQEGEGDTEAEEAQDTEKQEPERKSRAKERIHQLTEAKKQLEAQIENQAAVIQRLEQRAQMVPQIDPEDYEGQQAARLMGMQRNEQLNDGQGQLQALESLKQKTMAATFEAKCEAVADRLPGVVDKVLSLPTLTATTFELMAESDRAAEIGNYLGSNQAEAIRISNLPPVKQAYEIAKLETRFSQSPKPKRVSNAPNPPPKVTPKGAGAQKDPASMTMKEYEAWRSKGGS